MSVTDRLARPRTLAVLLAVSLALNLFLAGILAGRYSAHRRDPGAIPVFGIGGHGFESGFRRLPRGEREEMRELLRERHPELKQQHAAVRRLHGEIAKELQREAPDRALIEGKLTEIRAQTARIEQAMQSAFLDRMLAMDAAARQSAVERMLRHHRHGPPPGPPPAPLAQPELPPLGDPDPDTED